MSPRSVLPTYFNATKIMIFILLCVFFCHYSCSDQPYVTNSLMILPKINKPMYIYIYIFFNKSFTPISVRTTSQISGRTTGVISTGRFNKIIFD